MKRETFIDGDKVFLNTDFYLYLSKCEDILNKFEKWLVKTYYLNIPDIASNSPIKEIYDKLQELKEGEK